MLTSTAQSPSTNEYNSRSRQASLELGGSLTFTYFREGRERDLSVFAREREKLPELLGKTPEFPSKRNGTFEPALNVGDPENVDMEFVRILSKVGAEVYSPRNEPWKMRSVMITDPEGNLIEIVSDFWE